MYDLVAVNVKRAMFSVNSCFVRAGPVQSNARENCEGNTGLRSQVLPPVYLGG